MSFAESYRAGVLRTCYAAADFHAEHALCGAPAVGLDPLHDWPACERHGGLGRCKACGRPLVGLSAATAGCCGSGPICEVCEALLGYLLERAAFLRDVETVCRETLAEVRG